MRLRTLKTETSMYEEHLSIKKPMVLEEKMAKFKIRKRVSALSDLQTNFSINVTNTYVFILLHLKRMETTKNTLNLHIPDICIFHAHAPYEILYSDAGDIKSYRGKDALRLKDMHGFFKNRVKMRGTQKQELSYAGYENEDFRILTDTDLFIACRKFKTDPFFHRLDYIRNKLTLSEKPIAVEFDSTDQGRLTGEATASLIGHFQDKQILQKYGEIGYLRFLNEKIALFLNYEQNIRLNIATFFYAKSPTNEYYLINVKALNFTNLSGAIKEKQKRALQREKEKNKILIMSPQKQMRYASMEKNPMVKCLQKQMNSVLFRLADSLMLMTNDQRKLEEEKNEAAFRKLYPTVPLKLMEVINTSDFKHINKNILKNEQRKSVIQGTKRKIKFYRTGGLSMKTESSQKTCLRMNTD